MLPLAGPRLLLVVATIELLLCGAVVSTSGAGPVELRAVIRLTAMVSLLCFLGAFCATALVRRWPSPTTRWLVANRRWLGLSLAASHAVHGVFIWLLVRAAPQFSPDTTTRVFGGLGFVMIALLAATSNDAAVRALGPRGWRALHLVGTHVIWFDFVATYASSALKSPLQGLALLALLAAMALRIATRRAAAPAPARAVHPARGA